MDKQVSPCTSVNQTETLWSRLQSVIMMKRPVASSQSRSLSWRRHKFGVAPSVFQKGQLKDGPSHYSNWSLRPMRSQLVHPWLQQVQSRNCRQTSKSRNRLWFVTIKSIDNFVNFGRVVLRCEPINTQTEWLTDIENSHAHRNGLCSVAYAVIIRMSSITPVSRARETIQVGMISSSNSSYLLSRHFVVSSMIWCTCMATHRLRYSSWPINVWDESKNDY